MNRTCIGRFLPFATNARIDVTTRLSMSTSVSAIGESSIESTLVPLSVPVTTAGNITSMRAWQLDKYAGINALHLKDDVTVPAIRGSNKLLIEVRATSVNPLDVFRTEGYGTKVIGAMRCLSNDGQTSSCAEFPLILGRDFSGIVRGTSADVRQFDVGDEVMGFVQPQEQGCHAEYVVAATQSVVKKPKHMSFVEAASVPYVGLTAWSSLCFFGGVRRKTAKGRRALILGGSGGIGTFAIQLLKAWGMHVTTVVNGDAIKLVTTLGADCPIDYTQPNWENSIRKMDEFDIVLNCTTSLSSTFAMDSLKVWGNASYVHTMSPLLRNIDALGWPLGIINSVAEFGFDAVAGLSKGQWYRWGYIIPSKKALEEIGALLDRQKIIAVVEEIFTFEEAAKAYEKVRGGHARGKTVITLGNEDDNASTFWEKAHLLRSTPEKLSRWNSLF